MQTCTDPVGAVSVYERSRHLLHALIFQLNRENSRLLVSGKMLSFGVIA